MAKRIIVSVMKGSLPINELVGDSPKRRIVFKKLDFRTGVCTVDYSDGTQIKIMEDLDNESRRPVMRSRT